MPRYCYRCESCEQEFIAFHSISETKDGCDLCGHESVKKMLSKPVVIRKNKTQDKATGKLTDEYIEANRELLKDMKKEAKNGTYE